MPEEPKRLNPTPEVVRELYLKSGNVCAFPGCSHPIVNAEGVYVANLCHIESALEGGSRFNGASNNEERRLFKNLLLMCHRHHKETDDEAKFPVSKMQEIKSNHERKFSHIVDDLIAEVFDRSQVHQFKAFTNLNRLFEVSDMDERDRPTMELALTKIGEILQSLPPQTRKIFSLFVSRCTGHDPGVGVFEFAQIVSLPESETMQHMSLLDKAGLLYDDENSEDSDRRWVLAGPNTAPDSDWPACAVLPDFCEKSSTDLDLLLVDLDFSVLQKTAAAQ
jgi:hypothetical protein